MVLRRRGYAVRGGMRDGDGDGNVKLDSGWVAEGKEARARKGLDCVGDYWWMEISGLG